MSSLYKDDQSSNGSSESIASNKMINEIDISKANDNNSYVIALSSTNTSLSRGSNLDVNDTAKTGRSSNMKRSSSSSNSVSITSKKQLTTTMDVNGEQRDMGNVNGSPSGNTSIKNTSAKKIVKKQSSSSSPKNDNVVKSNGNKNNVDTVGHDESERTTPLLTGKKLSMSSSSSTAKKEKKIDDASNGNNKKSKKKESEKNEPAAVYNNNNSNDEESMDQDAMDDDGDGSEVKKDVEPETTATLIKGVLKTVITTVPLLLKLLIFAIWVIFVFLTGMMKGKEGRMASIARIKEGMDTFLRNSQETAMSLMKRVLITLWFMAVIFAVLSLLGIQPKKYVFSRKQAEIVIEQTDNEVKDVSLATL